MSRGLLFWILMLLWLVFSLFFFWPHTPVGYASYAPLGSTLLLFILFALLGWQVFGPPIQGGPPR